MNIFDETTKIQLKNTAITLGKFDSLHLGHQKLIEQMKESAKKQHLSSTLFSFDTTKIMKKQSVLTKAERVEVCKALGIEQVIFYPVTKETMSMLPQDFIRDVLVKQLDAKVIVTGRDFCFGRNRSGNVAMLEQFQQTYGYQLILADCVTDGKEKVSSSEIKKELFEGKIEKVNELLGYPYFVMGEIVTGKRLGRTIGIPTINVLQNTDKVMPKKGVYQTNVYLDGETYRGMTNVGINPTVDDTGKIKIETHILDFDKNVYGKTVKIEFLKFIREERKFSDLDELKAQILLDISSAKN